MRAFSILAAVVALGATSVSLQAADTKRSFKLHQDRPVLVKVDLASQSNSHGDMLAFEAPIRGENGLKGRMFGILITVDIADGDDTFEDRSGQINVDLGNGNSLIIAGKSVYMGTNQEIEADTPQLRAVIGGTGDYMGARGQVSTTRNSDGTYEHVVDLLD